MLERADRVVERARRVRPVEGHVQRQDGAFVDDFSRSEQLAEVPEDAAHRRRASSRASATSPTCPARRTSPPTGAEVQAAYDVAPRDIQHVDRERDGSALNLVFRTGPCVARQARASSCARSARTVHPPAGDPRHAVRARGRRRRPPRQPRGQPDRCSPTSRSSSCSCSWRSGSAASSARCCRSCRCSSRSAPPRCSRGSLQPQAQPDDRGRRPARRRRVHRVHVADPAAVRRGAAARPRRRSRRSTSPRRAPGARVHRVGAHRDRRRRGDRDVVAAAAARLRPASWR